MIHPTLSIARNTFTESIRQPVFTVIVLLVSLLLYMAMMWSGYTFDDDNKLFIDMALGMSLVGGVFLTAFTASGVLAREIENKTALTVISKPIGRPTFVIGKYLGVIGAIGLAFWIWTLVFLMLVRHGVLSAAYMKVDGPVVLFGLGGAFLAFIVAVWGNFFYGWVFNSRFMVMLAVAMTAAFAFVLIIDKEWGFQTPLTEFEKEDAMMGQVAVAMLLVFEGLLILSAVAIACSTRLGQVMTLLVCFGICALGLISDGIFGRHVDAHPIAWIGYALSPNIQFLFLADALTQRHPPSGQYLWLVSGYAALYTTAVLALATALFQTRETG